MGKSADFIKNRINSQECTGMEEYENVEFSEENFMNATKRRFKFEELVKFNGNKMSYKMSEQKDGNIQEININIEYNPNAGFEHFAITKCLSNGTLCFALDAHFEILKPFFDGSWCDDKSTPSDIEENYWNYDIHYIVGDFVSCTQVDEKYAPKDKPQMSYRFTLMLPFSIEFVKRED